MMWRALIVLLICLPSILRADDRLVRLYAPEALVDSGVLQFILPRFSLKTQVRVEQVGDAGVADLALGDQGRPVFAGLGQTWHMDIRNADHPGTARLADWLLSEIGQNTVASFAPDGDAPFGPPETVTVETATISYEGDAEEGHRVSVEKCTRCHAVDAATRGAGIGSTPSFGVLRALPDWDYRFTVFYVLNPHPSFTQITDVTPPFPIDRPSPIVPIELTLDELEALMAYVAGMDAADLGAPLAHQ